MGANILVPPKAKPKVSSGSPTVKIPGQGQAPSPVNAGLQKDMLNRSTAGQKNQNNAFAPPSSPSIPNGSGPGTGINPGGAKNGSTAPPGGTGLPLTGGGTAPPGTVFASGQAPFSGGGAAASYRNPGSTSQAPVGEQGMWDSANQFGTNAASQMRGLQSQLPGTNTFGGSGAAPFSSPAPIPGQIQAPPQQQGQPPQVSAFGAGPANGAAAFMGGIDPNILNSDGVIGGPGPGEYYPGNGAAKTPPNDGFTGPGGMFNPTSPGTDSALAAAPPVSAINPYGDPAYGTTGPEGPFNNPNDPTTPPEGPEGPFNNPDDPTVPGDPRNGNPGQWGGTGPVDESTGATPAPTNWGGTTPGTGGGPTFGGGGFQGTDPQTGSPVFGGTTGGTSGGSSPQGPTFQPAAVNTPTGSPASGTPFGGDANRTDSGPAPAFGGDANRTDSGQPPAFGGDPNRTESPAPPVFGGGGQVPGVSGGTAGAGNVATNTNNLTFQAPKAVGQQSEAFSEDSGEGGGKSKSQNSSTSSSTSHSENKSANEAQSASTGRAQDKSQSSSTSDVKHTFDPSQAKDFVGDVAREQMPSSPFSQSDAHKSLNQANARVAAGSAAQMDQLNSQLAGAGFDPNSAAGRSLAQQIMRERLSSEVQNSVNIPMEFAQKHGAFEQANAGMNVTQRGQDVQQEGLTTSLINSLLGQSASNSQSQSEGFSNQDSQSNSLGSSSGFSDSNSLANSLGWSESEDWKKNQGKSGSFSVPVFA